MKVSSLLAQYPSALDVLVAASPAFEKLKNPLLRRMFASRVSIEQAARIGGVSTESLMASLRNECDIAKPEEKPMTTLHSAPNANTLSGAWSLSTAPGEPYNDVLLRRDEKPNVDDMDVVHLDVREDLAQNQDPFRKIMRAVKQLDSGQVLHLVNGFEPVPLYDVLANRGFSHRTEYLDGVWHVYFFKMAGGVAVQKSDTVASPVTGISNIVALDVSGLEPPEPMQRILDALASLPQHSRLLVHHHREPHLLYEQLRMRGFSWTTDKLAQDRYRIQIYREVA